MTKAAVQDAASIPSCLEESSKNVVSQVSEYYLNDETKDENEATECNCTDEKEEDKNEEIPIFERMMLRGEYMKELRLMAEEDERLRQMEEESKDILLEDTVYTSADGRKSLEYRSYLTHQRYYDDVKHVDVELMDFSGTSIDPCSVNKLIIEQRKTLGKGGYIWDAGYILTDYLVQNSGEWRHKQMPKVLELGAGTGVSSVALACHFSCEVLSTDLPELQDLLSSNIEINRESIELKGSCISSSVLQWGVEKHYPKDSFDIIIGADVIAGIYDFDALINTLYNLSSDNTLVLISVNYRLTDLIKRFEGCIQNYFSSFEIIDPRSTNRNPNVRVIKIGGKRS